MKSTAAPAKTVMFYNLASADSDRKGLPFILAAKKLGLKTIVATHSSDTNMLCGDVNEIVPFTDFARLQELIRDNAVNFLMTVNSRLTPLVAELSKDCTIFNFSPFAATTLNYKDRCAEFIRTCGLPAPRHWLVRSLDDWGLLPQDVPLILKPTFSTGAIDTIRFESGAAFKDTISKQGLWCTALNRNITLDDFYSVNTKGEYFGRFILQEHINYVRQVGMEVLIVNGIFHLVHGAEILTLAPDHIKAYAHLGPVEIPDFVLTPFKNMVAKLSLQNCHMTPDFLIDKNGKWFLIDANLNIGGEGLIDAIRARDLNYPEESLKAFFGLPYSLRTNAKYSGSVTKPAFSAEAKIEVISADTFERLLQHL